MPITEDRFTMPKVSIGDCVLFSKDIHNFSDPAIAWVMKTPGERTIQVLAFTESGFIEKSSVHHKDDPDLQGDHGWEDLGVWDYTQASKTANDNPPAVLKEKLSGKKQ